MDDDDLEDREEELLEEDLVPEEERAAFLGRWRLRWRRFRVALRERRGGDGVDLVSSTWPASQSDRFAADACGGAGGLGGSLAAAAFGKAGVVGGGTGGAVTTGGKMFVSTETNEGFSSL